jgi:hypothetical protein
MQILVFNHIQFAGIINPYPYLFFIMILPFDIKGRWIIILSALIGISIDFITYTMGLHMLTMVFTGYLRTILIPRLAPQGDYETGTIPSIRDYGWNWYFRYSTILILSHHTVLFFAESFSFMNTGQTLLNILSSSVFTFIIIIIFQLGIKKQDFS